MSTRVPFDHVLAFLQEHGWELTRIWKPYRVFTKPGRLPILVEVQDRMVDIEHVEKVKQAIEQDENRR